MNDRDVIQAFIEHLRTNGYPALKVDCWPEDKNKNDIDAIAGPFAISSIPVWILSESKAQFGLVCEGCWRFEF